MNDAKLTNIGTFENVWLNLMGKEKYDLNEELIKYYKMLKVYIIELMKRNLYTQEEFNELINNIVTLYRNGFSIQAKDCDLYFYDFELGIVSNRKRKEKEVQDVPFETYKLICGWTAPEFYINFTRCSFITEEEFNDLLVNFNNLHDKVTTALYQTNLDNDNINYSETRHEINDDQYQVMDRESAKEEIQKIYALESQIKK